MTFPCPECGATATVAEYNPPPSRTSPPRGDADVAAECDHLDAIFEEFTERRQEQIQECRDTIEDEIEAIESGDYAEPHPAERNKCPFCSATHSSFQGLVAHVQAVHLNKLKTCPYCGGQFKNMKGIKHHIRFKHDERDNTTRSIIIAVIADAWGVNVDYLLD